MPRIIAMKENSLPNKVVDLNCIRMGICRVDPKSFNKIDIPINVLRPKFIIRGGQCFQQRRLAFLKHFLQQRLISKVLCISLQSFPNQLSRLLKQFDNTVASPHSRKLNWPDQMQTVLSTLSFVFNGTINLNRRRGIIENLKRWFVLHSWCSWQVIKYYHS